jgi:uncharacterized protein YggT (Ycf19 family)
MILATLLVFIDLLLFVLNALIIVRMITNWVVPTDKAPRFRQLLLDLTEPAISPVRRVLPRKGQIDWAPWVTLLIFDLIRTGLYYLIFSK